jgi:hypothetical protein
MFHRMSRVFTFVVLAIAACDPDEPVDRSADASDLRITAAERHGTVALVAFAAENGASECAAVVLDDDVLVVDANGVVGTCDGIDACEGDAAQACGHSPDAVAALALTTIDDDEFRLYDWCPPEEQSCGPGGGYGCIDAGCKNFCSKDLTACRSQCYGDASCESACLTEAKYCYAGCC